MHLSLSATKESIYFPTTLQLQLPFIAECLLQSHGKFNENSFRAFYYLSPLEFSAPQLLIIHFKAIKVIALPTEASAVAALKRALTLFLRCIVIENNKCINYLADDVTDHKEILVGKWKSFVQKSPTDKYKGRIKNAIRLECNDDATTTRRRADGGWRSDYANSLGT